MPLATRSLLLITTFTLWSANSLAEEKAKDKPVKLRPQITLSKETTRVTGPLTKDGYIDYASAINERLSVGVTAENNANVLLWKALGPHPEGTNLGPRFFKLMNTETLPETGDYFANIGMFVTKQLKLKRNDPLRTKIVDHQSAASAQVWTAKQYPNIAAWIRFNEKPLALVTEASKRPRYYSPLIVEPEEDDGFGEDDSEPSYGLVGALLPGVQSTRSFARALSARAMLHLGNGRHEAAWEDIMTCHRLGRLVAEGPTLIEALVGIAIDSIASESTLVYINTVRPNAEQSALLARQLSHLPPLPPMADRIDLGERFAYLDVTQRVAGSEGDTFDALLTLAGTSNPVNNSVMKVIKEYALARTDWDVVLKKGNRSYDQLVKAMRIEDRATGKAKLAAIDRDLEKQAAQLKDPFNLIKRVAEAPSVKQGLGEVMGDLMISLLLPATVACKNAENRAFQVQDNLQVAFALSGYHRDQGEYPAKLAALVPDYIEQVPIDRFNGKPLVYRRVKAGYLFYSVGRNEKDDQGRWFEDQPRGDDLRVRMPRKPPAKQD